MRNALFDRFIERYDSFSRVLSVLNVDVLGGDEGQNLVGLAHDMACIVLTELLFVAESPGDTDALDLGMACGEHIDARIAYIHGVFAGDACVAQDVEYDGGVGLHGYAFALSVDG